MARAKKPTTKKATKKVAKASAEVYYIVAADIKQNGTVCLSTEVPFASVKEIQQINDLTDYDINDGDVVYKVTPVGKITQANHIIEPM